MLLDLPFDIFRVVLKNLDPSTENVLIRTHTVLKDAILLDARKRTCFPAGSFGRPKSRLYNVLGRSFPWIPRRANVRERLLSVLDGFEGIAALPNVILSGGSLVHVLTSHALEYKGDLDFFIYGRDHERRRALLDVLDILRKFDARFYIRGRVIEVFVARRRPVQIVMTCYHNPHEVVEGFDLGYVQIYFDGEDIWATHLAMAALRDRETSTCHPFVSTTRVEKAWQKGFQIIGRSVAVEEKNEVVTSRFLVKSLRAALDRGDTEPALLALPKILDEMAVTRLCDGAARYDGNAFACVPFFRDISLNELDVVDGGDGRLRPRVRGAGTDLLVTSCPMKIKYQNDGGAFGGPTHSTVFEESDFNRFVERVGLWLKANVGGTTQRSSQDLRLVWQKDVVLTDSLGCAVEKKCLRQGTWVRCEVSFMLHVRRIRGHHLFSRRIHKMVVLD
jgi:hypothetical protein